MRISFNEKTLQVQFHMDEQDEANAHLIEQLMSGKFSCRKCGTVNDNKSWELLKGYFASSREAIIFSMKEGLRSRVKRGMTDIKAAQLDGFDSCVAVPAKVVAQAQLMRDLERKKKKENTIPNEEY